MALRPYPGFVGPSYTSQSKIAAYDRTVNWYPERIESGTGTATYVLYPCPGYLAGIPITTSPGRAMFALNGVMYVIYGSSLYVLSDSTILKAQGLSDLDGSVAQIIGNGDAGHQLLLRCDTTLYAFDVNAAASETTLLDPPSVATNGGGNAFAPPPVPPMVDGFYGYSVTFVMSTGETTGSPRSAFFIDNADPSGFYDVINVDDIPIGVSLVTARKIYRTDVQASESQARTAQLKLLITIADNTTRSITDTQLDASLGANIPTTNTATIETLALETITDPATSNKIDYLNTYGLSLNSLLSQVNFSEPLDFTDWPALNVFQRSDAADRWLSMIVHHKEVWLFGSDTTSVYYNDSDDPDEPFKPISSVFIQVGIIAPLSACVVDGQLMWIGQGADGAGVVYRANGYTPERVSTHAVEFAFSQLPLEGITMSLSFAEGSTYQENGHTFYEITIPTLPDSEQPGSTWVYDATAGLWHERGAWNGLRFMELDTRGHAQINALQYTMSRTTGNFYTQSTAFYAGTDGLGITRLRRAPHINEAQLRTRFSRFRLLMETGLGLVTGQGSDPQITLRWSDDGGQTFGSAYTVSAGKIGEFSALVEWWQLGQARDRIFEVTCSDPVPWRLVDAFLDYSVGPS